MVSIENLLTRFFFGVLQTAFHLLETYWCWQVSQSRAQAKFGLMLKCSSCSNLNTLPYIGLPFCVGLAAIFVVERGSVADPLSFPLSRRHGCSRPILQPVSAQYVIRASYSHCLPLRYPAHGHGHVWSSFEDDDCGSVYRSRKALAYGRDGQADQYPDHTRTVYPCWKRMFAREFVSRVAICRDGEAVLRSSGVATYSDHTLCRPIE
jgi:hypothetical protein